MKKSLIVFSLAVLCSCSAKILMPSESDASRGASKFPGLTVAELNRGKAIYEDKCAQCHEAKKPRSQSEASWRKIVPEMSEMAHNKKKKEISTEEQSVILKYLITMSSK